MHESFGPLNRPMNGEEDTQRELERRIFHLKTLYDVSQGIGFLAGTEEIMKNLLLMVMGAFGALSGLVLLVDTNSGRIEAVKKRGLADNTEELLSRALESGGFRELKETRGILILDKRETGDEIREKRLFDLLSSLEINVWIPFKVNESLRGGIGLGAKLSGDPYTSDDRELLSTLSNQGAFAMENSKLLEQMKREEVVRTNLSRYLSPQIVDQVIRNDVRVNLGGQRKVVTVLFSDIRDFTAIAETRLPDQFVKILNEYFTEMAAIIFENQGSLDKYIGDAIVAVFGSLIPVENPALHALEAAVQMMKSLPALNEQWMKEYEFSMDIGIGITTGEVFLGNIGSPERMEFTVIGDTVNVASRFSGLAKAGQILITRKTLDRLAGKFTYMEHPPIRVKGKSDKLEVFEILH